MALIMEQIPSLPFLKHPSNWDSDASGFPTLSPDPSLPMRLSLPVILPLPVTNASVSSFFLWGDVGFVPCRFARFKIEGTETFLMLHLTYCVSMSENRCHLRYIFRWCLLPSRSESRTIHTRGYLKYKGKHTVWMDSTCKWLSRSPSIKSHWRLHTEKYLSAL